MTSFLSRQMRIAIVLNSVPYTEGAGGAELFASMLATGLAERAHRVSLLRYRGRRVAGRARTGNFELHESPVKGLKGQLFMVANLIRCKPDVCLAISSDSSFPVLLYSFLARVRCFVWYAGSDAYSLSGLVATRGAKALLTRTVLFSATRTRFRHLVLSRDMWNVLASHGVETHRLLIVPTPVDDRFFSIVRNPQPLTIGYVGRLEFVKGCDVLLIAFGRLLRDYPSAKLMIVGDGSLRQELIRLSKALGVENSVVFTGFIPFAEIPSFLGRFSVFVLPSRSEGLPNALLQAMAAGLPVVATRAGGVPEIVEDRTDGLLVEPNRPVDLANAISEFISSESLCRTLGQNAKAKAAKYSYDRVMEIYESLLSG
jgi:glycosyltransferase involved in cell wall biosynthesis